MLGLEIAAQWQPFVALALLAIMFVLFIRETYPVEVTAMGGAAGGAIALTAAWSAPELASHPQLPRLRRLAGLFLLLAGLVLIWRGIDR